MRNFLKKFSRPSVTWYKMSLKLHLLDSCLALFTRNFGLSAIIINKYVWWRSDTRMLGHVKCQNVVWLLESSVCTSLTQLYLMLRDIYIYRERERERERERGSFGGLGVACWPLVPKFAGSNPAEAVGFLGRKNPQHAFLWRGSKAVGPMS